jgi:hypothetical protein
MSGRADISRDVAPHLSDIEMDLLVDNLTTYHVLGSDDLYFYFDRDGVEYRWCVSYMGFCGFASRQDKVNMVSAKFRRVFEGVHK